ncbi:hypothetical protein DINM_022821 [Dirofilaria immitis]|nr:hypothetical protein [Dirofilaria immitis]
MKGKQLKKWNSGDPRNMIKPFVSPSTLHYCKFAPLQSNGSTTTSLRFYVPPNGKKCLKEEIHKNVVVTGSYEFADTTGYITSVHVTDTRGHTLYQRERFTETSGKFAFTADEYDIFEICFSTHLPPIAEAEQLKPLEVELRRLEDLSDSIVQDFAYMRQREEEMRTTNESTNSRVLYLSIFSMLCLLSLAIWQVLYLRRYFKAKKLID